MKAFELFGAIALDDKEYTTAVVRAERQTEKSGQKMQRDWDKNLSKMQGKLDNFGRKMQQVGGAMSTRITAPIVAMGGAALLAANNLGKTADRLLDLEQMTGLTTDTLQEFENVARAAGVQSETLSGAAEGLTRRLRAAGPESKTFAENIEALGVSTRDANGELRSTDDLMPEIIDRLGRMDNITERNALSMQIFGRRATELAPVLALGSDEIARLSQEAHDMGQVMSREALNAANEYRIEWEQTTAELKIAGREITQSLLPIMKSLVTLVREQVVPWVKTMGDRIEGAFEWFQSLSEGTQKFIGIAVAGLAASGPVVMAFGATTRAVSGLIGVVRTLRTVMLVSMGPAGWITLLAAAVGVGLVKAWDHHGKAVDRAIEKTDEVRDALGKATDKDSLRGTVNDLAKDLDEKSRPAFVAYAEQAIETSDDIEEAVDKIAVAWAKAANARELAILERNITRVNEQIAELEANQTGFRDQRVQDLVDGLDRLRTKQQEILEDGREVPEGLLQSIADQEQRLAEAMEDTGEAADRTGEQIDQLREKIAELEAQKTALIEGSLVEVKSEVEITPTVVPDPNNPDATEGNPTGLPPNEEERTVIYNVEVRGDGGLRELLNQQFNNSVSPIPSSNARGDGGVDRLRELRGHTAQYHTRTQTFDGRGVAAADRVFGEEARNNARFQFRRRAGDGGAGDLAFNNAYNPFSRRRGGGAGDLAFNRSVTPFADPDRGDGGTGRLFNDSVTPFSDPRRGDGGAGDLAFNNSMPTIGDRARGRGIDEQGRNTEGHQLGQAAEINAERAEQERIEQLRKEAEARQAVVDGLTVVGASDGPLQAMGKSMLDLVSQKVPAFGAALQGFSQGGPIGAVAAVFQQLLGESEAFQNILGMLNKALEPVVEVIDVLFTALTPLVEVAIALFQAGLQPLLLVLEHVVAPVFTAVANLIKGIWNGIAKALNAVLGIFGIKLPLIGEGDDPETKPGKLQELQEERQQLLDARAEAQTDAEIEHYNREIRKVDEKIERLMNLGLEKDEKDPEGDGTARGPEVNFGGTPQAVQLAVATPLVDAAYTMLEAAMSMRDAFAGVGTNAGVFDRFAGALEGATPALEGLANGIDVRVSTLGGDSSGRRSGTAHLRPG